MAVLGFYLNEGQRRNGLARVFVTGSADGLGKMAGELLIEQSHQVVLHARSNARADETRKMFPEPSTSSSPFDHRGDEIRRRPGQQARQVRRRHPQCRDRLPRTETYEDGGRPAPTLRREHSSSVHPYRPHRNAQAAGVFVLRDALRRRISSRRHALGEAPVERPSGIRRDHSRTYCWRSRLPAYFPG
jgi:hypothetical protein